jgi:hypothetical protein
MVQQLAHGQRLSRGPLIGDGDFDSPSRFRRCLCSASLRVAREYMIRLGPIAQARGFTPEAFRRRYGYLAAP